MNDVAIGIIGGGNMGKSLLSGLLNQGYSPHCLHISDHHPDRLKTLGDLGVQYFPDNHALIKAADIIILAVKPQAVATLAADIKSDLLAKKPLIISIAAGITLQYLETALANHLSFVRVMPNTPAMIGAGMSAGFANNRVTVHEREMVEDIFKSIGTFCWLTHENDMNVVTALSGSGPAYVFLFMEAMQKAGVRLGLTQEAAHLLTAETMLGAARLVKESGNSPELLRKQVTSPGGTTEKAVELLQKKDFFELIYQAVLAAKNQAEILSLS